MLLRTDILQKTVVRCPCLSSMTFFLGTTCLPSQEGRRFFTFKRKRMSTYYFNKTTTTTTSHYFSLWMSRSFSLFHPPPPHLTQQLEDVPAPFVFFLSVLMTLIASIITFSKINFGKKNVTLDPRHGTLALDMEPSTLDPRQKDRLLLLWGSCQGKLYCSRDISKTQTIKFPRVKLPREKSVRLKKSSFPGKKSVV